MCMMLSVVLSLTSLHLAWIVVAKSLWACRAFPSWARATPVASSLRVSLSANWSTTPPTHTYNESAVTFPSLQYFPKTGVDLILDPTRSGGVLPLLMKPATTFSNTVGGTGDVQNATYRVAIAKFDVLQALRRKLDKESGRHDVLAMIARRLNQGPWGEGGSAGSRIGTLEL
ncbi:hypothetical protein DM02DRAFT_19261 [Periconia macrospinosa]|uniref:Uncharacterized protein n=1 Tax=Periconia macrospinosa TaxID=97972 RepID=A0A2V1DND1_9PLEO|nr:hypothetical protein DM02DRAFT_19261 [Periconia macrospinosa]